MKTSRYAASAVLGVLAAALTIGVVAIPAQATSSYDDALHATSTLEVYTDGATKSQTMDISASWWTDFKQTYAKRVQQNIGWPSNFVEKFEDIVQSGGSWGVYTTEDSSGKIITIAGTEDPDATCSLQTSGSIDFFDCMVAPGYESVRAQYFTHNSYGGNGCWGSYADRCSDNGMNVYQAPDIFGSTSTSSYAIISMGGSGLANSEFFVMNFNIDYPSGYEGDILPTTRHTQGAEYVAMGDSYSSGLGNDPYEVLSNMEGIDTCSRSTTGSYPYMLFGGMFLDVESMSFVACAGATTGTVLNRLGTENAQIDALSSETEIVTLTIGGNDIGFADIVNTCASYFNHNGWGCSTDSVLGAAVQARLDALDGSGSAVSPSGVSIIALESVLAEVGQQAPSANVYIAGYPHLFGDDIDDYTSNPQAPGYASCVANQFGLVSFAYNDAQWMNDLADDLNDIIESSVLEAQTNGVNATYVYPGGFDGHGLCDTAVSYFHEVSIIPDVPNASSLHPTVNGITSGYLSAFAGAISS